MHHLLAMPDWSASARANFSYPLREELPKLACPTLLLVGDLDDLYGFNAEALTLLADGREAIIPGARGSALETHPTEWSTAVLDFLSEPAKNSI